MSFGDLLYRLSGQEQRSAPVPQRLQIRVNPAAVAVTPLFVTAYTVPLDKVLILKNCVLHAVSGAAQTCSNISLWVYADNAVNALAELNNTDFAAPALLEGINPSFQDVPIMPGESLVGIATFNAAAAANRLAISVHGLLIPKGNVQHR